MKVSYQHAGCSVPFSDANIKGAFDSILDVFRELPVPVYENKSSKQASLDILHSVLNAMADEWFHGILGWERECTIAALTAGVVDEAKSVDFAYKLSDGRYVALEVQFGNSGRLQADFAKFKTLYDQDKLALAVAVYFNRDTGKKADSGLAVYETALNELHKFGDMPISFVGVSREDTPEVDLRELRDIVFPSLLGGSGESCSVLQAEVARAIVHGVPISTLNFDSPCLPIVESHAMKVIKDVTAAVRDTLAHATACKNPNLHAKMMASLVDLCHSTYEPEQVLNARVKTGTKLFLDDERDKGRAQQKTRRDKSRERKRAIQKAEIFANKTQQRSKQGRRQVQPLVTNLTEVPFPACIEMAIRAQEKEATPAKRIPGLPGPNAVRVPKAVKPVRREPETITQPSIQTLMPAHIHTWSSVGAALAKARDLTQGLQNSAFC